MNPKTLQVAMLVAGPVLIAAGEWLQGGGSFSDPSLWLRLGEIAVGVLFGKEVLRRRGDISMNELPAEWRDSRPQ